MTSFTDNKIKGSCQVYGRQCLRRSLPKTTFKYNIDVSSRQRRHLQTTTSNVDLRWRNDDVDAMRQRRFLRQQCYIATTTMLNNNYATTTTLLNDVTWYIRRSSKKTTLPSDNDIHELQRCQTLKIKKSQDVLELQRLEMPMVKKQHRPYLASMAVVTTSKSLPSWQTMSHAFLETAENPSMSIFV